jgi:TetR/AcrR family transcriptional regulator, fatty acid metabolism regulator protein
MSKRNAILAAATRLFSQNGFRGTAMAELSTLTGAATGTIFHHFKNKEDLFLHVLKDVKESILEQFSNHRQECGDRSGMEIVVDEVAFYLHLAGTLEDKFLILHRYYPYRMAETSAECRNHLESIHTGLLDNFEAAIRKGTRDGSICVDDPRKMAMILFAMVDGTVRLNTYRVYDAGALYDSLLTACRRLLAGKGV